MKALSIFRPGSHIASDGTKITFSEADMAGLIDSYDPRLHEAPIVIGHPTSNAPAYGWIESLKHGPGEEVIAIPRQVGDEFSEWVKAGHYKKRSASLYPPDSPNNPVPGSYYLRHLGFLGAQPPAIKGMPDAEFGEAEGVLDFTDPQFTAGLMARVMRGLRDWMIGKEGLEEADKILPGWVIEDLEAEARTPDPAPPPAPGFSEGDDPKPGEETVDEKKLKADQDKLAADKAALAAAQQAFSEQTATAKRVTLGAYAENLAKLGKIPAAKAPELADFMAQLPESVELTFGEGDKKTTHTLDGWFRDFVEARPSVKPDTGSLSGDNGDGPPADTTDAKALSNKAIAYQEAQRKAGNEINIVEAVQAIQAGETI